MTRQQKIEWALYDYMFVRRGILMSFDKALTNTSGEPISFYGSDIPCMAALIKEALADDEVIV